jgi:hypothetical protein
MSQQRPNKNSNHDTKRKVGVDSGERVTDTISSIREGKSESGGVEKKVR